MLLLDKFEQLHGSGANSDRTLDSILELNRRWYAHSLLMVAFEATSVAH